MFLVLLTRLDRRWATFIRLAALLLISWTVVTADHHPGGQGRGLVISLLLAAAVISWLVWTARPLGEGTVAARLTQTPHSRSKLTRIGRIKPSGNCGKTKHRSPSMHNESEFEN